MHELVSTSSLTSAVPGQLSYIPIAAFEYSICSALSSQTFAVLHYIKSSCLDFKVLVVEVRSNLGTEGTCLYHVRVHGNEAKDDM